MESNELEPLFRAFRDRGDVGALAAVFEGTAPELLRTATALCGNAVEGEDLLQACFVSAIERRDTWDETRPLVPWLVGILTLHARTWRRRAARSTDPERVRERVSPAPAVAAEAREIRRELDDSINDLPEALRQVVTLHLRYDLAPAEIADALSRAPSTVRSQLQRGLARLRERLPRGIALGALVVGAEPRGLEAVRTSVLEQARLAAASSPPGAPASTSPGALLSKTAACLLVVSGALAFAPESLEEPAAAELVPAPSTPVDTASARELLLSPPRVAPTAAGEGRESTADEDHDERTEDPSAAFLHVLDIFVVTENGDAVSGARVALEGVRVAEEPGSIYGWRADEVALSTTDEAGHAQLLIPSVWRDKHPDAISFRIHHREFVPFCSDLIELDRREVEIAIEWGALLRVAGLFVDGGRGSIPDLRAELGPSSSVEAADWFELGDGRLATAGLAPGGHAIELSGRNAAGERLKSAIVPFEIGARGQLDLTLELFATARVTGRLAPEVPRPVRNGEVVAHRTGGDERKLTHTLRATVAADGTFVLDGVGVGSLEVAVLVDGWASESPERGLQPTVLVTGRSVELDVPMVRTGTLDFTVTGPDGEPAPGVMVSTSSPVYWSDGRWQYFEEQPAAETDARGRALLTSVPPGWTRVFAFHRELRIDGPMALSSETTLEGGPLAAGETRSVALELVRR